MYRDHIWTFGQIAQTCHVPISGCTKKSYVVVWIWPVLRKVMAFKWKNSCQYWLGATCGDCIEPEACFIFCKFLCRELTGCSNILNVQLYMCNWRMVMFKDAWELPHARATCPWTNKHAWTSSKTLSVLNLTLYQFHKRLDWDAF